MSWWLWALRAVAALPLVGLLMTLARDGRAARAAMFRPRPTTAQGLAGRFTPRATLIVATPDGHVGAWIGRLAYPDLEVVVAAPARASVRGAPSGARVVRSDDRHWPALAAAGAAAAGGEVLVFLPARFAVGRGFVQRIVAPLVDPFIGASVARVTHATTRGASGAGADLDAEARAVVQRGRHAIGAPVICDREPFAITAARYADFGGLDPSSAIADTDLGVRLYLRGFALAYVDAAVAFAPPDDSAQVRSVTVERLRGRRRLWRAVRRQVRRTKVLEGPEKTDVRWALRGAPAALWLGVGWVTTGVLRLADTSWAPELIAAALLGASFVTPLRFTHAVAAVPLRSLASHRHLLALVPMLPILALGAVWTTSGAALRSLTGRRSPSPSMREPPAPEPGPRTEIRQPPRPAPARAPRRRRRPAGSAWETKAPGGSER